MRGEGGKGLRGLSCAHGAQINFGDLTPYLTHGRCPTTQCSLYFFSATLAICQPGYLEDRYENDDGDSGDKNIPAGQDSGSELEPTNDVTA
jgi:hypothetical protein